MIPVGQGAVKLIIGRIKVKVNIGVVNGNANVLLAYSVIFYGGVKLSAADRTIY